MCALVATGIFHVVVLPHVVAQLVGERFLTAEETAIGPVADHGVAPRRPCGRDGLAVLSEQPGDAAAIVLGILELAYQRHQIGAELVARLAQRLQAGGHRDGIASVAATQFIQCDVVGR